LRDVATMLARALALALAGTVAGLPLASRAQVSPGPLAKAHAEFEGNLGCIKCHGKGEGEMDRKCLECHKGIALLVTQKRGFHGLEGSKDCGKCHPDHGGRDFSLIAWPDKTPEKFDHSRTGWALRSKHAGVECRKCHVPVHVSPEFAAVAQRKGPDSWAGLDENCKNCHEDIHRGALGDNCTKCHDENAWRPARNFNHAATAFPLTGKHAKVKCAECHEAERLHLAHDKAGRVIPLYKPLPHGECVECHADPHKGSLGPTCSRCHTTDDFKTVARFDHDLTRYPLRGMHAKVKCEQCHDDKTAWGKRPPFATCGGCHADPHAGQATVAGKAVDCAGCHNVDGFKTSTFTVARHVDTLFPLAGAHARVKCMDCHGLKPQGTDAQVATLLGKANVWIHPTHSRCVSCHRDPHAGRFSPKGERARANDCLSCHSMDTFHPSTFDIAAHQNARFRLEGAHRAVPCTGCHKELAAASTPDRMLPIQIDKRACNDCHTTPHGTQFDHRKGGNACDSCHGLESFKPAVKFDHDNVKGFPLEGQHRKVPCGGCHPTVETQGRTMTLYNPIPTRCESCHAGGVESLR
jgi:hypothetical protein